MEHEQRPPTSSPAPASGPAPSSASRDAFRRTKWIVLIIATLVVCLLDQWSKDWAQDDLRLRPGGRVTVVEGYFALSYVRNPGAAWGFLSRADESFRKPFFTVISLVAMLFILYIHYRLEPGQHLLLYALSLVMGGAVGNFIDRLRYNYVVDFIKVHLRDRFEWPTFNVADIAITLGVILLFAEMFLAPYWARRRAATEPALGEGTEAPTVEGTAINSSGDKDPLD